MSIQDTVIEVVRKRYEIPAEVTNDQILVSEETEEEYSYYGCSCCSPGSSSYIETTVWYQYVPEGKKRKVTRTHTYTGTVYELLQEEENNTPE